MSLLQAAVEPEGDKTLRRVHKKIREPDKVSGTCPGKSLIIQANMYDYTPADHRHSSRRWFKPWGSSVTSRWREIIFFKSAFLGFGQQMTEKLPPELGIILKNLNITCSAMNC